MEAATGPLRNIRVLEFSQIIAGPVAGIYLSDLGADVIKVEPLEGEARRNSAAVVPNEGKYFQSLNRGKRSLAVDLKKPAAVDVIRRLIPHIDVVLINYRNGVAERLGIDYESLKEYREDLIYASITGFGDKGPYESRGGSDIVAQAFTGVMAAEGKFDEDGAPVPLQVTPVIDRTSGLAAAMAISAALYERERTGIGQELTLSLLQSGLELLASRAMREPVHDASIRDPQLREIQEHREAGASYKDLMQLRPKQTMRLTSHRLFYSGYHTKHGSLILGAVTQQNRDTIRKILQFDDDTDSPDFDAGAPGSEEKVQNWKKDLQEIFMDKTAGDWEEIFVDAGVPASVVNFPEEMSENTQVLAMDVMSDLVHEVTGPQQVVGPIVRMSETPTSARLPAPRLGAHSRDILSEFGFTTDEIENLGHSEVIL
ncbi:MAG: CoA transferase [Chloroflexota bacterium]|nr:CoA transferase [Chloroflexota bacterium]